MKCKKENAMKKRVKTMHVEQKYKTCDKVFPSTMEVLMHTASEHSKDIKEVQKEIKSLPQTQNIKEDTLSFDIATKFKCFKCKEIVSIEDKFNDSLEEEHMGKLCTMFQAYGYRPGPAGGLHCTVLWTCGVIYSQYTESLGILCYKTPRLC